MCENFQCYSSLITSVTAFPPSTASILFVQIFPFLKYMLWKENAFGFLLPKMKESLWNFYALRSIDLVMNQFNILVGAAYGTFLIRALLVEIEGCARFVHIVDCCVHASTVGLGGQLFWFWTTFNILLEAAFETFVIWANLDKLEGRGSSKYQVKNGALEAILGSNLVTKIRVRPAKTCLNLDLGVVILA